MNGNGDRQTRGGARKTAPPADRPGAGGDAEIVRPSRRANGAAAKAHEEWRGEEINLDHPDATVGEALLAAALGTTDLDFVKGLVRQIAAAAAPDRQLDEAKLNFVLSVVKNVKPRDQLEAMLATQMAAVHLATMSLARQLARGRRARPRTDSLSSAFNKCARTFASQLEALKRHRASGEQKVTMQHVSVNEGGQAIVGNVSQAARAGSPSEFATGARQFPATGDDDHWRTTACSS